MISINASIADKTLAALHAAGQLQKECVVLWLSPRPLGETAQIVEAYVPEQEAEVDYFRIPPHAMKALMAHLRAQRLVLTAQVHSHPGRAFHSEADKEWAIVRHEGALSVVVPHFGKGIDSENFLASSAAFRLSAEDEWIEIAPDRFADHLRLT
jgi:proteasome lid subunit RPN8/RPN11